MEDYSLRGQVFQQIRDDILKGKYQENDELKEVTLGKELGVSRTPVREALRQLELEGLVKIVPNKGAYVTGISQKDVHDIYIMRSMLEGLSARWAAEHITSEQLEAMEEIIFLSEYHLERGNSEQLTELDGKFHSILYAASNSRFLEHELTEYHRFVKMSRRTSVGVGERAKESFAEHKQIFEALKSKDGKKAEEVANLHILHVMENLHIEQE